MPSPSEQQNTTPLSWWVRLCQWAWTQRGFIWGTLIVGIFVSVVATWLTTQTSIFTGTPLGTALLWIRDHLLLAGFIGLSLFLLTLLVGAVGRLTGASTRANLVSDLQQSRGALIRLLGVHLVIGQKSSFRDAPVGTSGPRDLTHYHFLLSQHS